MIKFTQSTQFKTTGAPHSVHDETEIVFSVVNNTFDQHPTQVITTIGDFKDHLLACGATTHNDKKAIGGVMPAIFNDGVTNKSEAGATGRQLLLLDFDDNPEFDQIHNALSDIVYYAWSTFSDHVNGNKNRFRVAIPFASVISKEVFKTNLVARFKQWFLDIGFTDAAQVDLSALTFVQFGIEPAINSARGKCDLYFNDGVNTHVFDPELELPQVAQVISEPIQYEINTNVNAESVDKVVELLKLVPELQCIDANPAGDRVNRKTMAANIMAIGGNLSQFAELDSVMKKYDSKTDTQTAWKDGSNLSGGHAGFIMKYLTYAEKIECGLIKSNKNEINSAIKIVCEPVTKASTVTNLTIGNGKLSAIGDQIDYLGKNILVHAPTSAGKTYWISNSMKESRIILCPTRSLVDQVAKQYGATPFHGESRTDDLVKGAKFIATTFDSLKNLISIIGESVFDRVLVIDEPHTLVTDASYRDTAIRSALDLSLKFNTRVMIGATIIPCNHPAFDFDHTYIVQCESAVKVHHYKMITENITHSIINLVTNSVKVCHQAAVYLNNTQDTGKFGKLSSGIAYNNGSAIVAAINAKTRGSNQYKAIVEEGDAGDMVLINTSVLREGISITKHKPVVDLYLDCVMSHYEVIQYCARFRNAEVINIFHMTTRVCEHNVYVPNIESVRNKGNMIADMRNRENAVRAINPTPSELRDLLALKGIIDPNNGIVYSPNGTAYVDELLLSNVVYEGVKNAVCKNYDLMKAAILSIVDPLGMGGNWTFHGVIIDDNSIIDENTTEHVKANSDMKKVIESALNYAELQKIGKETVDDSAEILDAEKKARVVLNKNEKAMRTVCGLVAEACDVKDSLAEVANYVMVNDVSVAQAKKMVQIKDALDSINDPSRLYHKEWAALRDAFKVGQRYTTKERNSIIFDIFKNAARGITTSLKDSEMMVLMTNVFQTSSKVVKVDGKTVRFTVIDGVQKLPSLVTIEEAVTV